MDMQINLTNEEMDLLLLFIDLGLTSSELLLDTRNMKAKTIKMEKLRDRIKDECVFNYVTQVMVSEG